MTPDNDIPEREQRVADLLHAAARSERAPESLQASISAMRERASERASAAARRGRLPRPAFNFVRLAMPAAAAGVAALVLTLGGPAGAPSIAQAASLATRAPSAPAPALDPSDPGKLLSAKVGTLHFPNWASVGGWRAVGQRYDHLGNRTATTVYYAVGSSTVAYSILSSPILRPAPALELPPATPTQYYRALARGGRTTVVWNESGHTCLLTGPRGMSAAQLWGLASDGFGNTQVP